MAGVSKIEKQVLSCADCQHEFILQYIVPMPLTQAVELFRSVKCPKCHVGSKRLHMLTGARYYEAMERLERRET